jgi:2-polyprenyl-3-methyl-5-hydroxy-6-metoxy-1,4-benzoquinol methylase
VTPDWSNIACTDAYNFDLMTASSTAPCRLCGDTRTTHHLRTRRTYLGTTFDLRVLRCTRCDFCFLEECPEVIYNAEYLAAEGVLVGEDASARFHNHERLAGITRNLGGRRDASILDIGPGDGLFLGQARAFGFRVAAFDVNADGLRLVRDRLGADVRLASGGLDRAFADDRFDVIHMNEVIEHIPDPLLTLRRCRDRLTANGLVVIQTGNVNSVVSKITAGQWDYIRPVHVSYFSPQSMRWALNSAGFVVRRIEVVDWRVASIVRRSAEIARSERRIAGLRWLAFALSCKVPGVRRSITTWAEPA